ncbi:MAG: DnaD domain protein [Solobacterium sp.]|jgi:replication initiation and membrane attachment protein DnaB|nr:DnaD domain protein [Solobacterium sp.]MCH4265059.1 DnaD domain protein [Solobacterium sp.]
MELKTRDIYRIDCSDCLSCDALTALCSLYQPLTGSLAIMLYLTMYSEGRLQHTQENHARLCTLLNCSIDDLERARVQLEQVLLVKTFRQEQDQRSSYVYLLNAPLPPASFLSSREFTSEFVRIMGKKDADLSISKLSSGRLSTSGYQDVTRPVSHSFAPGTIEPEETSSHIEPRYSFSDSDVTINFDYEHFIATTSTLVFPSELRTQEVMSLIGRIATLYGLSADRMRILVSWSVNLSTMTFDSDKLKLLAEKSKPDVTKAKDLYSLPPVSFLQAKQNGAPVSLADKKILENLLVNYKFKPEIINIMVEYILKISQNRLIKNFVEMVAGEWSRDQVDTRDKAIAETKKKLKGVRSMHEDVLPAYMDNLNEKIDEAEHSEVSEEDRKAIEEMIEKMRKQ